MKTHLILTIVILAVIALPPTPASAGAPEKMIHEPIFAIFRSSRESNEYWREAVTIFDVRTLRPAVHFVCGRVLTYGRYWILCGRAEGDGKVIEEAYYASEDSSGLTLKEEPGRFLVVLPSGFVLLEASKLPNKAPLLTPTRVTPAAGAPGAPPPSTADP